MRDFHDILGFHEVNGSQRIGCRCIHERCKCGCASLSNNSIAGAVKFRRPPRGFSCRELGQFLVCQQDGNAIDDMMGLRANSRLLRLERGSDI